MQAVAGLGNPGESYAHTRHNAGAMLLEELLRRGKVLESRDKEYVHLSRLKLGPDSTWLIRPTTYMNSSGLGVAQACQSLQLQPADVLVAYDDIDLPLGQMRLRRDGGAGGHRGMESLIAELGTDRFPRLRLGIRGEGRGPDTADYVLTAFDADELFELKSMIDRGADAVRMILRRGLGPAMNTYNVRPKTPSEADIPSTETPDKEPKE